MCLLLKQWKEQRTKLWMKLWMQKAIQTWKNSLLSSRESYVKLLEQEVEEADSASLPTVLRRGLVSSAWQGPPCRIQELAGLTLDQLDLTDPLEQLCLLRTGSKIHATHAAAPARPRARASCLLGLCQEERWSCSSDLDLGVSFWMLAVELAEIREASCKERLSGLALAAVAGQMCQCQSTRRIQRAA